MRILFTLFMALTASAAFADFNGTILSYDQLSRLNPQKREAYLAQYRQILIMMEKQQIANQIYEAQRGDDFSGQVAMMMNYFAFAPQAEADGSGSPGSSAPQVIPEWKDGTGWDCSRYTSGKTVYRFDPQIGTCIQLYTSGWFGVASNFNKGSCPEPSDTNEGTIGVPSPRGGGTVACVPLSSYNALSDSRRAAVQNGDFLKADSFKNATQESTRAAVVGKLKTPAQRIQEGFESTPPPAATPADSAGKKEVANKKGDEPPAASPEVGALGETSCKEPPNKTCPKKPNDLETVKAFRTAQGDTNNSCIVGGFFSKYSNPDPRKMEGKCQIPTKFPKDSSTPAASCRQKGTALCNPFLFCATHKSDAPANAKGVQIFKKGDPVFHCEPVVKTSGTMEATAVTARCEVWRNTITGPKGGPNGANACPEPFKSLKAGSPGTSTAQLAAAWDDQKKDFEENFKKRCVDGAVGKGFQDLFCEECNVMKRMLYSMNMGAIAYGCASKPVAGGQPPATDPVTPPAAPAAPVRVPAPGSAESTR